MTVRAGLVAACVTVLILLPRPGLAAGPVGAPLPPGAHALATVRLPGYRSAYAVVYRSGGLHLGLVRREAGRDRIVWKRSVSSGAVSLAAPGPAGMFRALVTDSGSSAAQLYAYLLQRDAVSSAIDGQPSGSVSGDDGIVLTNGGFKVRVRDLGHRGSVAYRTVTAYHLSSASYVPVRAVRVPDYPANGYPVPNATVRTAQGNRILIKLEVAATEQARATGLMYRRSLDPDAGMIFVWPAATHEAFWMENTYVALTVAFLDAGGRIQEMQDMQPLTTTLHLPAQSYRYAVEVNQGFFAANGIGVGDVLQLQLQ